MAFTEEQRMKIWNRYHAGNDYAMDVYGRSMSRYNFEADHIWPEAHGGSSVVENGIPVSSKSNEEKSDYTKGYVNGASFIVYNANFAGLNVGELHVNGYKVSK